MIDGGDEIFFFMMGSNQGLIPHVVQVQTGSATEPVVPGSPEAPTQGRECRNVREALLVTPAERYDVIVDFSKLPHVTKTKLLNAGPNLLFQTFESPAFECANDQTTGQVMQFVIDESLRSPKGDLSTPPQDLILEPQPKLGNPDAVRDLTLKEQVSSLCAQDSSVNGTCGIHPADCISGNVDFDTMDNSSSFGKIASFLGHDGSKGASSVVTKRWMDPIEMQTKLNSTEE